MTGEHVYRTEEGRKLASLRQQARWAADKRLRANHQEEFERIHAEERVARGLPAESVNSDRRQMRERIAILEARVRELEGASERWSVKAREEVTA
jgi:transcription elongation GreA/GreB family factor